MKSSLTYACPEKLTRLYLLGAQGVIHCYACYRMNVELGSCSFPLHTLLDHMLMTITARPSLARPSAQYSAFLRLPACCICKHGPGAVPIDTSSSRVRLITTPFCSVHCPPHLHNCQQPDRMLICHKGGMRGSMCKLLLSASTTSLLPQVCSTQSCQSSPESSFSAASCACTALSCALRSFRCSCSSSRVSARHMTSH